MFLGLQRTENYEIAFDSTTIPYAIEVDFAHDLDADNGGTGKAFAVNPIGYKKNLTWSDDGSSMKVILMPTTDANIDHMHDFKFYVAGKIQNLSLNNIQAYDVNGNDVAGVTTTITQHDI